MTDEQLLAAFRRNPNGTWTPLQTVQIGGVTMGPGVSFSEGVSFSGVDVAALLNAAARRRPDLVKI